MSQNDPTASEKEELTGKQLQAALLLAKGATIVNAAKDLGISEKTLDRWKKLPTFKTALRQAEDELYSDVLARLKREASGAIDTLVACTKEGAAAPYVRVQAASKILDASLQAAKVRELEALLADLEERTVQDG
jgi:transposase-like protein